ncbi:MAG: diguanylate cyclase [Deltaproteobacteria bacterium]|nr:diguanylate cyclase [Deltaproteobacteria bacterium]
MITTENQLTKEIDRVRHTAMRMLAEARKLAEVTTQINRGLLLDEVLDHIYEHFRDLLPYDRIGFARLSEDGTCLRAIWARTESADVHIAKGFEAPLSTSLGKTLAQKEPRVINDLREYLADNPQSDATQRMLAEGIRSSLSCPLHVEARAIGFLFFSCRTPHAYEALHQQTFVQIATQVAGIIDKSQLYQELVETQEELKTANQRLEELASLDGLTGVANRRAFDGALTLDWRRATRSMSPLSLLMIDIDHFKRYNDSCGHQAGDACLKEVAAALGRPLHRAGDLVARYGGEEFAVVLPSTPPEGARHIAETIRQSVQDLAIRHPDSPTSEIVTISIGVSSTLAIKGRSAPELIAAADKALYHQAKETGRDRSCFVGVE